MVLSYNAANVPAIKAAKLISEAAVSGLKSFRANPERNAASWPSGRAAWACARSARLRH